MAQHPSPACSISSPRLRSSANPNVSRHQTQATRISCCSGTRRSFLGPLPHHHAAAPNAHPSAIIRSSFSAAAKRRVQKLRHHAPRPLRCPQAQPVRTPPITGAITAPDETDLCINGCAIIKLYRHPQLLHGALIGAIMRHVSNNPLD